MGACFFSLGLGLDLAVELEGGAPDEVAVAVQVEAVGREVGVQIARFVGKEGVEIEVSGTFVAGDHG